MDKKAKIYVAGHNGMVGSAIVRSLQKQGYENLVTASSSGLDLTNQEAAADFFKKHKPDYVFLAAAKVGGIVANNTYRAQFIYENLMIQNNVIHHSYLNNVQKLLFLGSSCIYPRLAPQPIKEEYLLTGELEFTNEPYAIAKIAGIKMCEAYRSQYGCHFISAMPTNLYGQNDNYNLETSHVLPALIRKMHLGKALMNNNWELVRKDMDKNPVEGVNGKSPEFEIRKVLEKYGIQPEKITLWGTGSPLREFLHVEDMASACVFLMQQYEAPNAINSHVNVGCGTDLSIKELAEMVQGIVEYKGSIIWDSSKPDGTPKKQLDISKLSDMGWKPGILLNQGINKVYNDYLID